MDYFAYSLPPLYPYGARVCTYIVKEGKTLPFRSGPAFASLPGLPVNQHPSGQQPVCRPRSCSLVESEKNREALRKGEGSGPEEAETNRNATTPATMAEQVGVMPPPPGVTPDFDGGSYLQDTIVIVYSTTFALATILLALRLYTGIALLRKLGLDAGKSSSLHSTCLRSDTGEHRSRLTCALSISSHRSCLGRLAGLFYIHGSGYVQPADCVLACVWLTTVSR